MKVAERGRGVGRRRVDEEELLVAPELFTALALHLPALSRVEVWKKRGRSVNELTRFRYDVVLTVRPSEARPGGGERSPEVLDWRAGGLTLAALGERLAAGAATALVVGGIPHPRPARGAAPPSLPAPPRPPTPAGGAPGA